MLMCDVHWAKWKCTDPGAALNLFQNNQMTKQSAPASAVKDDEPIPMTTAGSEEDGPQLIPTLVDEGERNELLPMHNIGRSANVLF